MRKITHPVDRTPAQRYRVGPSAHCRVPLYKYINTCYFTQGSFIATLKPNLAKYFRLEGRLLIFNYKFKQELFSNLHRCSVQHSQHSNFWHGISSSEINKFPTKMDFQYDKFVELLHLFRLQRRWWGFSCERSANHHYRQVDKVGFNQ